MTKPYEPKHFHFSDRDGSKFGHGPRYTLLDLPRAKFCMMWSICDNSVTDSDDYKVIKGTPETTVFVQGHNAETGWFMLEIWAEQENALKVIEYLETKLDDAGELVKYETLLKGGWFDNFYPDTATGDPNLPSMHDLENETPEEYARRIGAWGACSVCGTPYDDEQCCEVVECDDPWMY